MARREFSKAIKVAVVKRASRDGIVFCEQCGSLAKRWQIDHVRADGLLGEPTIENAKLLGKCCYGSKNTADTAAIAQAKRREARHLGVSQSQRPIAQRPKAPPEPARPPARGVSEIWRRFAELEE